ncbi:hypothetical protein GCM10008171_30290 [Methylopila jiangsuensis]|uniref:DUF2946 domain-containing protein n=1 Tax=Methylopila jiangsuensis TaxID=586230 RepID=A0A9W6JHL9_9HYPH|nr:hypothetical protein [Methylopila jiangsuensis]MDR6284834.1 hypothetical protein [Methylopila jiangsuensis]GLK77775.1 hypothetical protein GCM10008171_30290 [Methylopila jiangsuensis]
MDGLSKAKSSCVWRLCARLAVAFCLIVFGLGDAVERGLAEHASLDAALLYAVAAAPSAAADHAGVHVDDASGEGAHMGGAAVGHGCHGCAALPERAQNAVTAPAVLGAALAWASVPSTSGRAPLVDLPPPRA